MKHRSAAQAWRSFRGWYSACGRSWLRSACVSQSGVSASALAGMLGSAIMGYPLAPICELLESKLNAVENLIIAANGLGRHLGGVKRSEKLAFLPKRAPPAPCHSQVFHGTSDFRNQDLVQRRGVRDLECQRRLGSTCYHKPPSGGPNKKAPG